MPTLETTHINGEYRSQYGDVRITIASTTAAEISLPKEGTGKATPVDKPSEKKGLTDEGVLSDRRLTQSELYPARSAFAPEHLAALRLLTIGVGRSQRSINALLTNDALTADTEAQKVQALLPELFCCRALGDGFGVVVNALMSSFEGLEGNTPSLEQTKAINGVLRVLQQKPFLTADEADDQLASLEAVGLSPYPPELLDFLSSD